MPILKSRIGIFIYQAFVLQMHDMFKWIYIAVFCISLFLISVLNVLAYNWLGSVGDPRAVTENYWSYSMIAWTLLWVSTAVLFVMAIVNTWLTKNAWALWATFVFASFFIVLRYFIIQPGYLSYLSSKNMTDSAIVGGPFIAVILCIVLAITMFFAQFIISRLSEKIYPTNDKETNDKEMKVTEFESLKHEDNIESE